MNETVNKTMDEIVTDRLRQVAELLDKKSNWTQGCGARDTNDTPINIRNESACKWCLMGAVEKVSFSSDEFSGIIKILGEVIEGQVVSFNDSADRTHDEVKDVIQKSIKLSERYVTLSQFKHKGRTMNNNMSLFDILSNNERVIVYSDVGDKVIYTWNQSLTLQCWERDYTRYDDWSDTHIDPDLWEEVNVRTLSEQPVSFEKAKQEAIKWAQE